MANLSLLVSMLFLSCASAARVTGTMKFNDHSRFAFLGKFAFDYSHNCTTVTLEECHRSAGTVDLDMTVSDSNAGNLSASIKTRVLFFSDQAESWPTVYKLEDQLSCEQIVNRSIDPRGVHSLVQWTKNSNGDWIFNQVPISIKQHIRPRYWYIGLADCDNNLQSVDVQYDLTMLNVQRNEWLIEFGVDQQGLNTLYIVFFIVYATTLLAQIYNVFVFKRDGMLHPMIQLFVISLALETAGMICQMIHFTRFSNGGVGVPFLNIIGEVFEIFAHLSFLLLLILIAQGWTITENAIYHRKQLLGGLVFFTVLYLVALFLERSIDPASNSYTYSSIPGIMAAALNGLAGIWFIYSIYHSYKIEADIYKQHLYVKVAIIFCLWFWALPLELIVASVSAEWLRDIIVTTLSLIVTTLGYFAMVYLLWPSRAANYFAVTVTTNLQMAVSGGLGEKNKGESMTTNMLSDSDYNQL